MPSFIENGADGCSDYCGHLGGCTGNCSVGNIGAKDTEIGQDELGMGILAEVAISAADRQRRSGAGSIAIGASRESGGEYLTAAMFY